MGNESTTVVNHYHYEDLEKIRRESDERKQKMLLEQKIMLNIILNFIEKK